MDRMTFDFCPNSRVAEKLAPDEPEVEDFNGWVYNPTPTLPFRATFKVTLEGLRWKLTNCGRKLDLQSDRERNAGRLEEFYFHHRLHVPFHYDHEYMGMIDVRFYEPVSVPKGIENGGGVIDPLEVMLIHHTSGYR